MDSGSVDDFLDLVDRRADYLDVLSEGPLSKKAIIDRLDASRSTVDRAVRNLEDAGLVERTSDGYVATVPGSVALRRHREYRETAEDLATATEVLNDLPPGADVEEAAIAGSDVVGADYATPYRPGERLQDRIATADRYRAVLPTIDDPKHVRLLYECVVTDGNEAELVVGRDLLDSLRSEFPRRIAAMAETGRFTLLAGEVPPYGVVRTDRDGEAAADLLVFSEEGSLTGLLDNATDEAVAWADECIDHVRSEARDVTDSVGAGDRGPPSISAARTDLESEGFRRLSRGFFADRPAADPVTAWRAGLDLAEVQAGYAADRTHEVDGERRSMTDDLVERLCEGEDVAVVGPPGSGKSTVCKRVAVEWYRDGGDVYYRESGRGQPFESVEALTAVARRGDGRTLVVVEDAVRPAARAAFAAASQLAGESASFLVDARESEWTADGVGESEWTADGVETELDPDDRDRFEVVTMPRLLGADADRLVEQFEATVGVDVPGDRLRERIRSELADDVPASEAFLLTHRLATYAGADEGEPSPLEADVAAAYDAAAAAGDAVLDAAVAVNAFNAADRAVGRRHLEAVAGDALDAALDATAGRVLFPDDGDGDSGAEQYRTVHGGWSVRFLDHVLDVEGADAASERLAASLSAALDAVDADARSGTVRSIFEVGVEWPRLAPLFDVEPPDSVDRPTALQCRLSRGEMRFEAADFETAGERFRRLREDAPDPTAVQDPGDEVRYNVLAQLGVARVNDRLTQVERAREHANAALAGAEALGSDRLQGRVHEYLGSIAFTGGDLETATDELSTAASLLESAGDRAGLASVEIDRGSVLLRTGQYEAAIEALERGRDLAREVGDRAEAARATNALGMAARETGDLERAAECNRRGLAFARDRGMRDAELASLLNLGGIATTDGDHERALEYRRDALELAREIGRPSRVGQVLAGVSESHRRLGDADAAVEAAREALDALDEESDVRYVVEALTRLGHARLDAGDVDAARDRLEEALETCADADDDVAEMEALHVRGRVALAAGDHDAATDYLESAAEMAADAGTQFEAASVDLSFGDLALADGDPERAVERYESALATARDGGATDIAIRALSGLVDAHEAAGDHRAALDRCEEAIAVADAKRLPDRREELTARKERIAPEQ